MATAGGPVVCSMPGRRRGSGRSTSATTATAAQKGAAKLPNENGMRMAPSTAQKGFRSRTAATSHATPKPGNQVYQLEPYGMKRPAIPITPTNQRASSSPAAKKRKRPMRTSAAAMAIMPAINAPAWPLPNVAAKKPNSAPAQIDERMKKPMRGNIENDFHDTGAPTAIRRSSATVGKNVMRAAP